MVQLLRVKRVDRRTRACRAAMRCEKRPAVRHWLPHRRRCDSEPRAAPSGWRRTGVVVVASGKRPTRALRLRGAGSARVVADQRRRVDSASVGRRRHCRSKPAVEAGWIPGVDARADRCRALKSCRIPAESQTSRIVPDGRGGGHRLAHRGVTSPVAGPASSMASSGLSLKPRAGRCYREQFSVSGVSVGMLADVGIPRIV